MQRSLMRQKQNDAKPDGWLQAKFSHKAICYVSEEPTDAEMEETVDKIGWAILQSRKTVLPIRYADHTEREVV